MQLLKLESGKELAGRSRGPGAPNNIEAEGRGSAQYYLPIRYRGIKVDTVMVVSDNVNTISTSFT